MSLLGPTYAICHCSPLLPPPVCQFRVHSFFSLESWWPISKVRLQNKRHRFTAHACNREAGFIFGKTLIRGEKLWELCVILPLGINRAWRITVHICNFFDFFRLSIVPKFFPRCDINFYPPRKNENKKLRELLLRSDRRHTEI